LEASPCETTRRKKSAVPEKCLEAPAAICSFTGNQLWKKLIKLLVNELHYCKLTFFKFGTTPKDFHNA